ncbi:uncharacterized protein [Henckelia pumila]|uniref:uncharacterized protein isoform X1 n=1 Tax=Henckelia pumila TaxID=405737 RepID=UPI003C6E3E94
MRVLKYFLWRLPSKILNSGISLLNMETSPNTETMAKRRRPLHTCGASILAIGHNALTKAQDFDEPLGSMAKRAVSFFDTFFPFTYTILYQWLAMLSFMDDHILTVEHAVELVFPPSKCLFDKMDVLVCDAEVLPEKFDDILRRVVGMIMHKFPFLDWVIGLVISWLHFLVSTLNLWGSKENVTSGKEKRVGASCNGVEAKEACCLNEKANTWEKGIEESSKLKNFQEMETSDERLDDENSPMFKSAVSSPIPESDEFGINGMSKSNSYMKCTYKEMLESGDKGRW